MRPVNSTAIVAEEPGKTAALKHVIDTGHMFAYDDTAIIVKDVNHGPRYSKSENRHRHNHYIQGFA